MNKTKKLGFVFIAMPLFICGVITACTDDVCCNEDEHGSAMYTNARRKVAAKPEPSSSNVFIDSTKIYYPIDHGFTDCINPFISVNISLLTSGGMKNEITVKRCEVTLADIYGYYDKEKTRVIEPMYQVMSQDSIQIIYCVDLHPLPDEEVNGQINRNPAHDYWGTYTHIYYVPLQYDYKYSERHK